MPKKQRGRTPERCLACGGAMLEATDLNRTRVCSRCGQKSSVKRIPLSKLERTPCKDIGTPQAQHVGTSIHEVVCQACGVRFSECERCYDSDQRCIPCMMGVDPAQKI